MDRILKVKVVHDPDSMPATYLVDQDGARVHVEGATLRYHLMVDAKSGGLANVGIVLENVDVECLGSAVGQSFEMKTK